MLYHLSMIIPTFATPKDFKELLSPQDGFESCWYIFSGDQILISADKKSLPHELSLKLQRKICMGALENTNVLIGEILDKQEPPDGWFFCELRSLFGVLSDKHYALAGRAMQLLTWDQTHAYCGSCGNTTVAKETERCRECTSCGCLAYPKLAPVVMVLVKKGEKILLARGPHFPNNMYSILAGFVNPGETLEQCLCREVYEEVGITVKNIRYFGSQPWPFSNSLMIGYICEWENGEINIDPVEIEEAGFFDPSNLPNLPPYLSLARIMIDSELNHYSTFFS